MSIIYDAKMKPQKMSARAMAEGDRRRKLLQEYVYRMVSIHLPTKAIDIDQTLEWLNGRGILRIPKIGRVT